MTTTMTHELTYRALISGIVLGILLTPCNIYTGLKIGWSFNMSIIAALISYAFWQALHGFHFAKPWGKLECNINQTTASSAASIISGGLVAPIPALTLLTGQQLVWYELILWVFSVSFLGIWVAYFLRHQFLVKSQLALPAGVATAETLKDIFAKSKETFKRIIALLSAALAAGSLKLLDGSLISIPRLSLPFSFSAKGASGISFKNLGFLLDPSPLLIGFGAIIGFRTGLSLFLGAIIAWGILGPWILYQGWALPGEIDAPWFASMVEWLLWPGVALMVMSSLTSFALLFFKKQSGKKQALTPAQFFPTGLIPGLSLAFVLTIAMQMILFDIDWLAAILAVPLAFILAVVAGRVVGETGIPPIGAIGKVSQLSFGVIAPSNVTANLMAANVAGGAAGQCADLLNDFKTGLLIGATPSRQVIAQVIGVLTGSVVGSLVYLLLILDPATMLISAEWPAPAVATWKAVAETLKHGLTAIPQPALVAMLIAGIIGILLAMGEKFLAPQTARWLPNAPAMGLAFVIPAWIAIAMFIGACLALLLQRFALNWSQRFLIASAAGLIAGESIAGVIKAAMALF
jgi:uncharacterized oligopeptide transporter (OPT) family protein